jgi:hypothetical protein
VKWNENKTIPDDFRRDPIPGIVPRSTRLRPVSHTPICNHSAMDSKENDERPGDGEVRALPPKYDTLSIRESWQPVYLKFSKRHHIANRRRDLHAWQHRLSAQTAQTDSPASPGFGDRQGAFFGAPFSSILGIPVGP